MTIQEKSTEIFANIQKVAPVVHNISNYITAGDCANMTLACGGSPTMADHPDEVAEVLTVCQASVLNMGVVSNTLPDAMLNAGKAANKLGRVLVFDPVGAGGSTPRNETADKLLKELQFSVIRGNISEIKFLGDKSSSAQGVDAADSDLANEDNIRDIAAYAKKLSANLGSVIAISGPIDVVADAGIAYLIRNGHAIMTRITGTGCMLSSTIGVFAGANPENVLEATAVAVSAYGYAGELAYEKVCQTNGGTGSFRTFLIDFMSNMDAETFCKGAKIEIV